MKHQATGNMGMQAPLPVAYLTHYAELYGANRSLLDLMTELHRTKRATPFVIVPMEGPFTVRLQEEHIPYAVFSFKPWMSVRHYEGGPHHRLRDWWRQVRQARKQHQWNLALYPEIIDQLRKWEVDLVHANSSVVGIAPGIASAMGLPLVWHVREMPERQYHLHIHAGKRAYGRALRSASQVIAISQAVRRDILSYVRLSDLPVIYNGVVTEQRYIELQAAAHERWDQAGVFRFALVGVIHRDKGQEEAIRAMALVHQAHPKIQLVIAGGGNSTHLEQLVAELGLHDVIHFSGFVEDPFEVYRTAHATLMCSRHEGMGRVTIEAMASGIPVIGHASAGTLELVQDGVNGLLYKNGPVELAERMSSLVRDPGLARRLGDTAARTVRERFTVERYAGEVHDVYISVLSKTHLLSSA